MKIQGKFIQDLNRLLTIIHDHFILLNFQLDIREKKNKTTKKLEGYLVSFQYGDKKVKLEITGNGFVIAQVTGKRRALLSIDDFSNKIEEENIQDLMNYIQSDNEYELGKQCVDLNKAQFAA